MGEGTNTNFPFMSPAASEYAQQHDLLFFALTALSVFFTVIVSVLMVFFAVRYRRGTKVDRSNPIEDHKWLELSWIFGPMILALAMYVWSSKLFAEAFNPPADAREIFVVGKQWMWHAQHMNGVRENNEIHIPVDEPVKFTMISQDVVHALFIPEFRLQRQVFPGRYTSFWVKPNRVGRYHLYCNMYCGMQHSEMGGWVYVMSKPDFQKWLATGGGSRPSAIGGSASQTGGVTLAQAGASLYQRYQCGSCHSSEAVSRGRGPSLVGLYGKMRQLQNGRRVLADDGYLRDKLYYPDEHRLANWPQGMPAYKSLTEEQVLQINAYVKSLTPSRPAEGAGSGGGAGATANLTGAAAGPEGAQTGTGAAAGTSTPAGVPGRYGGATEEGGNIVPEAPAANTANQSWRYMYGGER